jgi:hypothetical protein
LQEARFKAGAFAALTGRKAGFIKVFTWFDKSLCLVLISEIWFGIGLIIGIEMSQRFSKSSKLIRKSLIKVYDHLKKVWKKFNDLSKKFGQSLGTPPLKVRITQTT